MRLPATRQSRLTLKPPPEPDPLESHHQETLFRTCALHMAQLPDLALLHAVPNGGYRFKATAAAMQRQGVKPGIEDIQLNLPRRGYHGWHCELKRFRNGTISEEQKARLERLHREGYRAIVCWGWQAAWEELLWYLGRTDLLLGPTRTVITSTSPFLQRKNAPRELAASR